MNRLECGNSILVDQIEICTNKYVLRLGNVILVLSIHPEIYQRNLIS